MISSYSYEDFVKTVTELRERDEKITVRNVHSRLGGSFGTVSSLLKRLREEEQQAILVGVELSDTFKQAMLNEMASKINQAKQGLQKQLASVTTQLDEANQRLIELEGDLSKKNACLDKANEALSENKTTLACQESTIAALKKQLDASVLANNKQTTEIATLAAKVQASDQLLLETKQQSKELSVQLKSVTHEKYEAEKKLAVLESKQMGKK